MDALRFTAKKCIEAIPLILGVTFISFVLMVYFGPDKTYDLLGKNPTEQEIKEIRHELGYDRPFLVRYAQYVRELFTLDFGYSDSTGERVTRIFARTIPVSLLLNLPGFLLGTLLGIVVGLIAAFNRGTFIDKSIMIFAVIGMSISFLIVIIASQIIFCSSFGLNLFPVSGWDVDSLASYIKYVSVPTFAMVFVGLGYNTRFYRGVFAEETLKNHVQTARAFGCPPVRLLYKHIFRTSLIPVITRVVITLPFLFLGGSLIVESYFSIPGIGLVTYDAITSGDQPILKALIGATTILYVLALTLIDILYTVVDPRVTLR